MLLDDLHATLEQRAAAGLRRTLRTFRPDPTAPRYLIDPDGRRLLNLAGNDYLALATHRAVVDAAADTARRVGFGAGASRLVCGHRPEHAAAEAAFARHKHAAAAVLLPTGYAANQALLAALAGSGDLVVQDRLNHASLLDAARGSGAELRTVPHGTLGHAKAARLLARHRAAPGRPANRPARRFVVVDAVFSMDGDTADLPTLLKMCEAHDAWLIADEAHATGVLGPGGGGLSAYHGVESHPRLLARTVTVSKALGGLGGVVVAPRAVIDTLLNHARPLIYSTAVPPASAAAATAALGVLEREPHRQTRLTELGDRLRTALDTAGWPGVRPAGPVTPIVPLRVGTVAAATDLADRLAAAGVLAIAIRPPTVPPGTSRVRLGLRADLTDDELSQVIAAVGGPPQR